MWINPEAEKILGSKERSPKGGSLGLFGMPALVIVR